jgi:peptide chain release factor
MSRHKVLTITMDDCTMQTFSCGGKGGQHRDHSNTGVRIIHKASGAQGVATDAREQHVNKRNAFIRMSKSFLFHQWVERKTGSAKTIEDVVAESMQDGNLKIEAYSNHDKEWRTL